MPILDSARVLYAIRLAAARATPRAELLDLAAREIRAAGQPYTSVYFYMLHGGDLVLEAHAGRETHHTRIPVGTGVCGTAVATGQDQNIGDVRAVANYLACNLQTRSELVVLIRKGSVIVGQIDIDSDQVNPFTPAEEAAVRAIAEALAQHL
jgi:L-methionine (R)-S-oxide reductase